MNVTRGDMFCPCGNKLISVPISCMICDKLICPKCVISSDLELCKVCLNEQKSFADAKELENSCEKCDRQSETKNCGCCSKKTLKFCSKHHNRCKMCTIEICQDKKICIKHSKECLLCGIHDKSVAKRGNSRVKQGRTLFECAECFTKACDACFNKIFDPFIFKWYKKAICNEHVIHCKTHLCNGKFYRLENNKCSNEGCQTFCCKFCGICKSGFHGCPVHIRLCMYKNCFLKDVESNMKSIRWRFREEKVCEACFGSVKTDIKNLLLVLNRYGYKFQKEIVEKIII